MRAAARVVNDFLTALRSLNGVTIAGLLGACLLLVLGRVPIQQNADDLLPAIVSLHKLTFYYWEQDRLANLLPLLTAWIGDPSGNLYAQIVLRVVAGLVAPVFFAAIVFRRPADIWRAALASDCLLLLTANPFLLHETFIVASPYGTSLACAGLAALALRRVGWPSVLLGTAGLLAAYCVNIALAIVALPLLAFCEGLLPSAERMRLLVLHTLAAFVAGLLPAAFAATYPTAFGLHPSLPALAWSLGLLVANLNWAFAGVVVVPVLVAMTAYRHGGLRRPAEGFQAAIVAMTGTAIVAALTIASSDHVRLNGYGARYYIPILLMLLSGAGIAVWQSCRLVARRLATRHAAFILVAVLTLVGAKTRLAALGAVNEAMVEPARAALADAVAARAIANKADAIVGDYWDVWPAVFAAEQARHDLGGGAPAVLGIAPGTVHQGRPERSAFLARLYARGQVRLVCLDLTLAACTAGVGAAMDLPNPPSDAASAEEVIAGGHRLRIVTLLPP